MGKSLRSNLIPKERLRSYSGKKAEQLKAQAISAGIEVTADDAMEIASRGSRTNLSAKP